jgi:hypothetical protein
MLPIIRGLAGIAAIPLTTICLTAPAALAHATLERAQASPG